MPPRSPLCPHHRFNLKGTELQKSLVWKGPLEIISSPLSSAGRALPPPQTRRAEGWMGSGLAPTASQAQIPGSAGKQHKNPVPGPSCLSVRCSELRQQE